MIDPEVIYEDKNFIAVNKPAGLLVHRADVRRRVSDIGSSVEPTLVDWLLKMYPEVRSVGDNPEIRPGIVHRLDRDTSGVMVVARNQKYFEYLKSLFQNHLIEKTYLAIAFGKITPKADEINKPISLRNGSVKRTVHGGRLTKNAVTQYKVLKYLKDSEGREFSLVEVKPKTGRTHQIRVHLSSIGHPVVGDFLYGQKEQPSWVNRLFLHARILGFPSSDGARVRLETEPPPEFADLFQRA
jgi:23S rRNA pseudouridine1911/1915/1917 synthase